MKSRGRRKRRSPRRARLVAARRAAAALTAGSLPMAVLIEHGMLSPSTGLPPVTRAKASPAERAHIERLHVDCREHALE